MASILFKVVRTCNSQFKCNYLKNKKLFLTFLFNFLNLHQILNILKEKMIVIANVFPKLQTLKIFVRKLCQEHIFRTGFAVNLWKHCNATPNSNAIIWKAKKKFLNFLFHFWILPQILNILKENMSVIANLFPKLETVKIFVRKLSQEHLFGTSFRSEHVKASQMLAKFPWERFYHVFISLSVKLIWKRSPLVLA